LVHIVANVTVIIAAWNAAETLERAVKSCLAQKQVTIEVIIVDDASTDNTYEAAKFLAAQDSRVRVIQLPQNGGPGAARNAGIDAATGSWLAVLDADDTMADDRLHKLTTYGETEQADAVYDNLAIVQVGSDANGSSAYLDSARFGRATSWDMEFFVRNNQAQPGQPSLGYLKPVLRTSFLAKHAVRYQPQLRNGEDFHLMLEVLRCGAKLRYYPEALYRYTTGGESISNTLNPEHARHLIEATQAFIGQYRTTLSSDVTGWMQRREQRLRQFASAEKVLRALKARRIGDALIEFSKQPSSLFRILRQLREACYKRLT
jgi:succinoglycan biosynthesis protein ExoO